MGLALLRSVEQRQFTASESAAYSADLAQELGHRSCNTWIANPEGIASGGRSCFLWWRQKERYFLGFYMAGGRKSRIKCLFQRQEDWAEADPLEGSAPHPSPGLFLLVQCCL